MRDWSVVTKYWDIRKLHHARYKIRGDYGSNTESRIRHGHCGHCGTITPYKDNRRTIHYMVIID